MQIAKYDDALLVLLWLVHILRPALSCGKLQGNAPPKFP